MPENKALLLMALSDFSTVLNASLLSESAHVSLSCALPQAFASWAILFLVALVGTYLYNESVTFHFPRAIQEFPRSESLFVAVLGWYSTPGYFLCEHEPHEKIAHLSPCPFWTWPPHPRSPKTFSRPLLFHDASDIPFSRSHDSQLAESPQRICGLSAFRPAFPIDVQSLQEGQCYQRSHCWRGIAPHVNDSVIKTLSSRHPSRASLRFRMNGSHFHRTSVLFMSVLVNRHGETHPLVPKPGTHFLPLHEWKRASMRS